MPAFGGMFPGNRERFPFFDELMDLPDDSLSPPHMPGRTIGRYSLAGDHTDQFPHVTLRTRSLTIHPRRANDITFSFDYFDHHFYKTTMRISEFVSDPGERTAPDVPTAVTTNYPGARFYRGSSTGRCAYVYAAYIPRASFSEHQAPLSTPRALLMWFSNDTPRRLRLWDGPRLFSGPKNFEN